ncbi:jg21546 [Pararge aegeria aegeria]|uniref:Jg21546 protein n=1 Tax=Pararge aegeria aegeria TaxID=348720 RepID=A0A8S4RRN5_9NEOP|nr:jg21546 [Pararge aegeria aegeria]
MTTLGRRVGHRRARLIAPTSLLPDTGLCHLFSPANLKWLYRLSVARASSVRRQGAQGSKCKFTDKEDDPPNGKPWPINKATLSRHYAGNSSCNMPPCVH